MFDIGWSELLVIGIVALVVIGPKELPGVLRAIGQMMGKVRRMASEFQGQFNDAMREAELDDLRKQAEKLNMTVNPLDKVTSDIQASLDTPVKTEPASVAPPAPTVDPVPTNPVVPPEAVPTPSSKSGSGS